MKETCGSGYVPDYSIGITDFSRGFVEGARLYVENKETRTNPGIAIIVGLISAFPEKINFRTLNKSSNFYHLCVTGHVVVLINDAMDMQKYLHKPEGKKLKERIENDWEKSLTQIGFCQDLSEEKKTTIKSYMAGITLLDDLERASPDNSSKRILEAKEMENAISIVHCAAMILDQKEIDADSFNLHENIFKKELVEKYSWLINGEPSNEVQRRLCGLFNVIMITQMVDDRFDYKIDNQFGIRNIYSSFLEESKNDFEAADKKYSECLEQYTQNAKKFGISEIATLGNKWIFSVYKTLQYLFPHQYGGYRERLLK